MGAREASLRLDAVIEGSEGERNLEGGKGRNEEVNRRGEDGFSQMVNEAEKVVGEKGGHLGEKVIGGDRTRRNQVVQRGKGRTETAGQAKGVAAY